MAMNSTGTNNDNNVALLGEFKFSSTYDNTSTEDKFIIFQYVENGKPCIIEASNWGSNGIFTNMLYTNVMTVNRLEVNPNLRGKGLSKELLKRMCDYADTKGITLELGVCPDMGSSLNYDDLIKLYSSFGFTLVSGMPSIMVRLQH